VAVLAVVAGLIADNDAFWGAAAFALSTAVAGLVAYAADKLNVFSQTAALLGRSAGEAGAPAKESGATTERLRGQVAFEMSAETQGLAAFTSDTSTETRAIVEHLFLTAAHYRHPEAARRLGQLCADRSAGTHAAQSQRHAEECLVKASAWGSLLAAYNLGALHATTGSPLHSSDWWLALAERADVPVAAYVAGRLSSDEAGVGAHALPTPGPTGSEKDFLPPVSVPMPLL